MAFVIQVHSTRTNTHTHSLTHTNTKLIVSGLWRNGSASDSKSEGWEFESLWPHSFKQVLQAIGDERQSESYAFCADEQSLHVGFGTNFELCTIQLYIYVYIYIYIWMGYHA